MNTSPAPGRRGRVDQLAWTLFVGTLVALGLATTASAETEDVVAVYSQTYNRYHRTHLPDKTVKPETFTFAQGGYWAGWTADDSIDGMPFMKIVRTIAPLLRRESYVTAVDPNKTDLIVFVYWGTTRGSHDIDHSNALSSFQDAMNAVRAGPVGNFRPQSTEAGLKEGLSSEADMAATMLEMSNRIRDGQNMKNARLLGFGEALQFSYVVPWIATSRGYIDDLERNRFFVTLRAYDFQLLWKKKKWKPLWETIYSIPQQGNRFDKDLAYMTARAAPYFGTAKGLVHDQVPEGSVQVGEPEVVPVAEKK